MELSKAIMLAKKRSVDEIRRNPDYTFRQLAVRATTIQNSGMIEYDGQIYTQKCFFIAVVHGLRDKGVNIEKHIPRPRFMVDDIDNYNAFKLAEKYKMLNHTLIDTKYPDHKKIIENIASDFDIRIQFYFGCEIRHNWYTTPDSLCPFGKGSTLIRILNKTLHFEYISDIDSSIEDLTEAEIYSVILQQQRALENIKLIQSDREYAKRLAEQEPEHLEKDYKLALQLSHQEEEDHKLAQQLLKQEEEDHKLALQMYEKENNLKPAQFFEHKDESSQEQYFVDHNLSQQKDYLQEEVYCPYQERDYRPRQERGYTPRQERGYRPRQERDYRPRQERDYMPRQERDYRPRQERDYRPRQGRDYRPRQERDYRPPQEKNYARRDYRQKNNICPQQQRNYTPVY